MSNDENKQKYLIKGMSMDDQYKLLDLYFGSQKYVMYSHLHNSFDKFIDDNVRDLLTNDHNIFFKKMTASTVYNYSFKFSNIRIKPPTQDGYIIYPSDARERNLTYAGVLVATVKQFQETIDIGTGKKTKRLIAKPEHDVPIATIPIMVRSKYCSLNIKNAKKNNKQMECRNDPGGYFIVNGAEKVVMSIERLRENNPIVFTKKDGDSVYYNVQVNSRSYNIGSSVPQMMTISIKKNKLLIIKVSIFNEVPVCILLRALGMNSDKDIIDAITFGNNDTEMIDLIRVSLNDIKNMGIQTRESAINYMIDQIRVTGRYSETDKDLRTQEKKLHLDRLLKNNFIPHMPSVLKQKGYYLGYIINRLLNGYLGRINRDDKEMDRDSYVNKRVDLPGNLLFDLFRQHYKKMFNECRKYFRKKNNNDENPINIISQIKPSVINQGLKAALLTGVWGRLKGVAQMAQRLTFLQTLSSLRRINSPTSDASTNKLTAPRHLHLSTIGYICYIETPEGPKVGMVKNLALMGNVTIMKKTQIPIIKMKINDYVIDLGDIPLNQFKKYTKIFLNGEWLGMTDKPNKLYTMLKNMKLNNIIDANTAIVHNLNLKININEITICCDGGRLFRPLLRVKNNSLILKKKLIDMIDVNGHKSNTTITSWNNFMIKNPGVIEYVDAEENMSSMLAMYGADIDTMRKKEHASKQIAKSRGAGTSTKNIINRYNDDVFVRYTHCEFHPSMHLGLVASNMPFCNRNVSPRNMFQFSQAKQATGIYASNYRDRLDNSFILFHPQVPIITTRAMKYIGTDRLPAGENIIVAISCYTGYNQEDSVIMNQSAVDRGLYRLNAYKKYISKIQKNQSTSKDDIFTKPNKNEVVGMRHGTYEKLNEEGFAPEETVIEKDDVILGKVSPIQPVGKSNKTFKDKSEVYKDNAGGVVDRVWSNIIDSDGYEMRKMRVRSERIPEIGDKMCSRSGQKGTIGIKLSQADMPFTENGITPDLIMNPNAIPSRMTMAQIFEALISKVSVLEGHGADGTPFNYVDDVKIRKDLGKLGYDEAGTEYMYNGMTGQKIRSKIFICPTYYQRLKHMVKDKIYSRARGPRTLLTHQPPEGRAHEGGLRFGEMERDAMIAHGIPIFLKERLMETSDAYTTYVCDTCGLFAKRMLRKGNRVYPNIDDIYICSACGDKANVHKIRIPYAFKLLIQELMSMNIAPRIKIIKDVLE